MSAHGLRMRRLSAPGRAALSLYKISGPEAASWLAKRFARPLPEAAGGAVRLGELREGDDLIDECLLAALPGTAGYELSLHGSPAVCRRLERSLRESGASFEDELCAAAELPGVRRPWLARHALHARGRYAFSVLWHQARQEAPAPASCDEVSARQALGVRKLWDPFRWVLVGAPNAGKSTLANALSGLARSRVTDTPGGTADPVCHPLCVDDIPLEVWDSAGEGATPDPVILAAQALAAAHRARADGWLFTWDLAAPYPEGLWRARSDAAGEKPLLRVGLKADIASTNAPDAQFHVSARTGEGLAELCPALSALVRRLLAGLPPVGPEPPAPPWNRLPALRFAEDDQGR